MPEVNVYMMMEQLTHHLNQNALIEDALLILRLLQAEINPVVEEIDLLRAEINPVVEEIDLLRAEINLMAEEINLLREEINLPRHLNGV
jgi:uncharacterized coiled-coil DUF342 family protein